MNELAAQVKIPRTTVMAYQRRRGVKTRRNVRKLDDEVANLAMEVCASGLSFVMFGRELDVNTVGGRHGPSFESRRIGIHKSLGTGSALRYTAQKCSRAHLCTSA